MPAVLDRHLGKRHGRGPRSVGEVGGCSRRVVVGHGAVEVHRSGLVGRRKVLVVRHRDLVVVLRKVNHELLTNI